MGNDIVLTCTIVKDPLRSDAHCAQEHGAERSAPPEVARLRHHGFSTPLRLGSAHSANIGSDALRPLRSVPYAVLPLPRFVSDNDSFA